MNIDIKIIGIVRNDVIEPARHNWKITQSEIVIDEAFTELLDGIEAFSHISVLFWLHKITQEQRLTIRVHPRRDETLPLQGVFATHTPTRPNPIGLTTVRLLERHNNILKVIGLDAINDTPILDIKPFIPPLLSSEKVVLPEWVSEHERG